MPSQHNDKSAPVTKDAISGAVELLVDLRQPPTLTLRNLHPYRLKVKKLRDMLRFAQGQPPTELIDILGEVKDAIGDWHDWEQLRSIGDEFLGESAGELVNKIKQITAKKFAHAQSSAMRMRQKYIKARNGRRAPAALRTTSALA